MGQIGRRRALVAILLLGLATGARAANVSSPVRFHAEGVTALAAADDADRSLDLDRGALGRLRAVPARESLRVEDFPIFSGATADLVLERFDVATPDARIVLHEADGTRSLPLPEVTHFRGTVEAEPDSRVYLGVHGEFVVAVVQSAAGLVYLGPAGSPIGPARHVLRRSDSEANRAFAPAGWQCDVEELAPASAVDPEPGIARLRPTQAFGVLAADVVKVATLSIETDQELLAKFGGSSGSMAAYVTTLVGQISTIYERDVSVRLAVNMIQAWSSPDPYSATSPRAQLDEVGDWWHANRPKSTYPRTLVHFLSGKPVTGGVAWLGVLCASDFSQGGHWGGAYGVTQINGAYPASLWDLIGVAHEIGHNFGTPHTHCFSPAIDRCYGGESGCYSGSVVNPGPRGGTIMSYCHLLPGGFGNIDLRFHERCVAERMLPHIAAVGCLGLLDPPAEVVTSFYTLTPCRAVDTRGANGSYGGPALGANSDRVFGLANRCGIPQTAKAVSVNVTVTQATAPGALRIYPAGTTPTAASAINYRSAQTRANSGQFPLGTGANLAIRCDQASGNVHAIIDVNGYYQ